MLRRAAIDHTGGYVIISVINHSKDSDARVQEVIRAINRQIADDFAPYWQMGARLRLEGRAGKKPDPQTLADMRGDAVLYLWDGQDIDGALGYHETNFNGIPYGFVFTELASELDGDWTVTLSHEALELIADPEANLLVQGPHPKEDRTVFHWFEMCDAVQDEKYAIDGVRVSNFVLPLYFTDTEENASRNDFLGTRKANKSLRSFGVNPGGYIGFYDPKVEDHATFEADKRAKQRLKIKGDMKMARRGKRYAAAAGNRIVEDRKPGIDPKARAK
jgi:hypothetical protein